MFDRLHRALPWLYLAWALPFVLTLGWLTPPFANPDEPTHLLRVIELAHGEIVGDRLGPHEAGGLSDLGIYSAMQPLEIVKFHPERKITLPMLAASEHARWQGKLTRLTFPNTAQYPPFLYLPAVAAARVGQLTRLSVDRTLDAARDATAVVAIALTALGIGLARRTRYALAAISMLPMTCALYASVSQDALMIALAILAAGMIDRLIERGAAPRAIEILGIAAAIGCVAMGRPPYAPLALLLLVPSVRYRWAPVFGVAAVILAVGAWSALIAAKVMVPFPQASPQAQLASLVAHPLRFPVLMFADLQRNVPTFARQFVGQLGWLDTSLPMWFIHLALAVTACGFLAALAGRSQRIWLPLLAVAAAIVLMFAIQYVTWTPLNAPFIGGLQGRYFLPLAPALALAVPGLPRIGKLVRPAAVAGLAVLAAVTPFVTVQALVVRYYLGG